jgi:hypothetical protein
MTLDDYVESREAHLKTGTLATLLGEHVPVCTDRTIRGNEKDYNAPEPGNHGTRARYMRGCRCTYCRDAKLAYDRSWRAGRA